MSKCISKEKHTAKNVNVNQVFRKYGVCWLERHVGPGRSLGALNARHTPARADGAPRPRLKQGRHTHFRGAAGLGARRRGPPHKQCQTADYTEREPIGTRLPVNVTFSLFKSVYNAAPNMIKTNILEQVLCQPLANVYQYGQINGCAMASKHIFGRLHLYPPKTV